VSVSASWNASFTPLPALRRRLFGGCSGDVRTHQVRERHADDERAGQLDRVELVDVDALEAGGTDVQLRLARQTPQATHQPLDAPQQPALGVHVLQEKEFSTLHSTKRVEQINENVSSLCPTNPDTSVVLIDYNHNI